MQENFKRFIQTTHQKLFSEWYFPGFSIWVFLVLLTLLFYLYGFHDILFLRPQGIHQWRQCDCLSLTLNYFQDGNSFFNPSIHNLGRDGTGMTVSDFPLIYYFVAQMWKVFGVHEFIYRLITLVISMTGLYFLFRTLEQILKDSFWALGFTVLFYTSPIIVYYSNNFLVNVPALSLAIVALYFFWRYYKTCKNHLFYLSLLFFLMGGLLKVTTLLSLFALLGILILELFGVPILKEGQKLFKKPGQQIAAMFLVVLIVGSWILYAHHYNKLHNEGFFLIGVLPVWGLDREGVQTVLLAMKDHLKWYYFYKWFSMLTLALFVLVFLNFKKVPRFFLWFLTFLSIGLILYVLLFFQALEQHDYYVINMTILVPVIFAAFMLFLKENHSFLFRSVILKIFFLAFIILNISFAQHRMKERYSGWMNEYRNKYLYAFETIDPYLDSIGIDKNSKIISLPDFSINNTLYLANRKGWTGYNIQHNPDAVQEKINQGAHYLLLFEKEDYDPGFLKPFIEKQIGSYKNVRIFTLKDPLLETD